MRRCQTTSSSQFEEERSRSGAVHHAAAVLTRPIMPAGCSAHQWHTGCTPSAHHFINRQSTQEWTAWSFSDLLARGLVLCPTSCRTQRLVADSPVGGGQSGRIELAAVIEVSDKGARTDGTGAQVSATVADVLARGPMR